MLSGFLITYLLIEEKNKKGKINIINFWLRRVFRIWPLFYFAIFFGFVVFPFLKSTFGQLPNETANIWYYLVFLNNFDFINNGLPDASILGVLWSVAIEEQFYFVWPLILSLFPVKKYWIPFSIIIFSSLIFRALNDNALLHEIHTISCIGDMSMGAFGAWLIRKDKVKLFFEKLPRFQIIAVYVLFFVIFFYRKEIFFGNYYLRVVERFLISLVIIIIILEQNFSTNSFYKMKNFKQFSKLGIITYGLYCLHFIAILITITLMRKANLMNNLWSIIFIETIVSFILSVVIAKISFKYLEKPFLEIKKKFS